MAKLMKRQAYRSVLWPSSERRGATAAYVDLSETLAVIESALEKAGLSQVGIDIRHRPDATYPPVLTFARYLEIARNALAAIDDVVWVVERLDKSVPDAELLAEACSAALQGPQSVVYRVVANALDNIAHNKAIEGRSTLAWARRVVRDAERAERRQTAAEDTTEDSQEGE